ncbi:hypothetical protein LOC68_23975 [Blastopirellula sp. JC732]|uniref:Uncharacterized protein n=1 Tax=Blastopirellula sediminis TaxID=2894196 RepID=A0A9X1SHP0_9BACT|nr:hypothetical protein [Blastopirellula sediminis]MCC9605235.1 hypothetical protein [Blastopirellula sediminis]MCC9631465.1 hypothetical protein [Blastopirellula sediminis]
MSEATHVIVTSRRRDVAPPKARQLAMIGTLLAVAEIVLLGLAFAVPSGDWLHDNKYDVKIPDARLTREAIAKTLSAYRMQINAHTCATVILAIGLFFACSSVRLGSPSAPRQMVLFSLLMLLLGIVGASFSTFATVQLQAALYETWTSATSTANRQFQQAVIGYTWGVLAILIAIYLAEGAFYITAVRYFSRPEVRASFALEADASEVDEDENEED